MGLQIHNQVLVLKGQHLARQRFLPVIHHALVLQEVLSDIGEVIDEGLTLGKELPVAAQRCVQRMAPRIDDLGIGQNQMNKSHGREVVGHLVNKARPAELPMDIGALKVLASKRIEICSLELTHREGIVDPVGAVSIQGSRDTTYVGKLRRAFDHRVACENLFDKG